MKDHTITLFPHAYAKTGQAYPLRTFLENIQNGTWKDAVQKVRTCNNEDNQKKLKEKLPAVTISGVFTDGKSDTHLQQHSNFIAIDLDDVTDLDKVKALLEQDPYTYAQFVSCRGKGLCVVVRIDGKKHKLAFDGLSQYYFQTYGLIVDPSGCNVSRLRFVSYDPDLRVMEDSKVFKLYPEKEKKKPDTRNIFFGSHDIDHVFDQIQSRQIDITGNYHQWCSIGFALADYFGEIGRDRFLAVSQFSSLYDAKKADQQYSACLRHNATSVKKVTIATFLWYCKQHGISIISEQTKAIVQSAKLGKNGSNTVEGTVNVLQQVHGIDPEMARPIVEQVYATPQDIDEDRIPLWVRLEKYFKEYQPDLKRNVLNQEVYRNYIRQTERDLIDITIDASRKILQPIGKDMVFDYMKSSGIVEFNPLRDFFEGMGSATTGHIRRLAESLRCKHGHDFATTVLRKWLVGCVGSAFDVHSCVMLVLAGKQKAGKSAWIKQLLPDNLYCRTELITPHVFGERAYQDDLVMSSSWIAIDEEFNSIVKMGYKRMKSMITQPTVFMRYNYDRRGQNKPRLVNFAGCANEVDFLEDTTGNRRFGVIEVTEGINWDIYNAVDKYELWKEAYHLYIQGVDTDMTDEEMQRINEVAEEYRLRSKEEELIIKFFTPCTPQASGSAFVSSTTIGHFLQIYSTYKNLSPDKIGRAMKSLGFDNNKGKPIKLSGKSIRGFWVLCDEDKRHSLK
ncbi:VapE domain-containing protein [Xanthocytophaga agilis]|uniref:VapE family protein n=1 Tax=Xanthocytophaga agilis TaxID=3048010 RepID=A0AAE3UFL8_9BACT|nr:VapE domain-containing protein [Xanthocytophaga agilis]MDJ1503400.1 VapE family protein [Xanthocytophaga agilis]